MTYSSPYRTSFAPTSRAAHWPPLTAVLMGLLTWVSLSAVAVAHSDLSRVSQDTVIASASTDGILWKALTSQHPVMQKVMADPETYEVQILFSQRQADGSYTYESFRLDPQHYFYPASTVKFPAALLTLEALNDANNRFENVFPNGILDLDTRFMVEGDTIPTTLRWELTKLFVLSDNAAHNRLHDLLGRDYMNDTMREKGLGPFRLVHRLSMPNASAPAHREVTILGDGENWTGRFKVKWGDAREPEPVRLSGLRKGIGYMEYQTGGVTDLAAVVDAAVVDAAVGTSAVTDAAPALPVVAQSPGYVLRGGPEAPEAFDFSFRNYIPVTTLHAIMERLIYPDDFPEHQRFNLRPDHREFVLETMRTLPRDAGYDPQTYYDGYVKFFLFGDTDANTRIPENVRIHNKVGYAYGTVTDNAFIQDTENGIEFFLTATILANEDGIFNDDKYEYDEIALPFMAELGRQVYRELLSRNPPVEAPPTRRKRSRN